MGIHAINRAIAKHEAIRKAKEAEQAAEKKAAEKKPKQTTPKKKATKKK